MISRSSLLFMCPSADAVRIVLHPHRIAPARAWEQVRFSAARVAIRRSAFARGRALTEASGGITLATIRAVAERGVDIIPLGALTHFARALDISLELRPT
jgi:hypothetical protein